MSIDNLQCLCLGYILLSLILWIFAGYAYLVNMRRPADDPNKKDFHFSGIFLAPITWPFFLIASFLLLVLRALLFGVSLLFFTLALVFIRKPFIFIWLDKIATRIGNKLLDANTGLINLMLSNLPPTKYRQL